MSHRFCRRPFPCLNCYPRSSVAIYRGVCTGARRRRRVGGGKAAGKHPGVRAHPLVAVVVREAARTGAGGGCSSGGSCTSSSTAASMAADGGFSRAQAAPAVRGRATASHVLCLALAWLVVAAGGGRSRSCLLQPWRDRAHARALESERERAESERECQREGRERLPIDAGRRGAGACVGNGRGELTYGRHAQATWRQNPVAGRP